MSPIITGILGGGGQTRHQWHVWQVGEAQGGLTFCSRMPHLPKKGITSPLEGLLLSFQFDLGFNLTI
jgi:hypothetical protein